MNEKSWKKIIYSGITLILLFFGIDNISELNFDSLTLDSTEVEISDVKENESYDSLQEVVDYLSLYEELPENYLTKNEAKELGWKASEGNLQDVAPGASIGGDYFGNFEGLLPDQQGRDYKEADINYDGGHRGAERLVFSNDGLYFYTDDHYESFEEIEPSGEKE